MTEITNFQHVDYLWDEAKAKSLEADEVALLLYRSNILGADLRITNFGGGNTSCKTMEKHPLTGEEEPIMWVKGSGGNLGTLDKNGLAALYLKNLRNLKKRYRGLKFEDEMVALLGHCIYDLDSRAPSIDTPLHALLPFRHIDHLHPDAVIAIAASRDGKQITQDLFEGQLAWVDWQRPGFDLALQLEAALAEKPKARGIMLGGHGLFTWGETSLECYQNSLEVIEKASLYIEAREGKKRPVFGGSKVEPLAATARKDQAAKIAPILRGFCSSYKGMIGHFTEDERVLQFMGSKDLEKLAPLGTSCPDHFLRTKIRPLVLSMPANSDLSDSKAVKNQLRSDFEDYRAYYKSYYEKHKRETSPAMRDPNPVVILWPGVGMFTFAKNKQTARVASEFYINAINVMRGAEAISEYVALPLQEAFDIEYWLLEEAKLQRQPPEKPLSRRVAFVTGGGGGIGRAIAEKLVAEGACVVLADLVEERLQEAQKAFGRDQATYTLCDVRTEESIIKSVEKACLDFGGIDIVINCAGLAISKPLAETSLADWNLVNDVLVKGQFLISQKLVEVIRKQGQGGDIINIASKNALVSGPNNIGYGTAKAAQVHMSRLLAAELGKDNIRVNVINPDAVILGSKIWEGAWAEGRAKAYGLTVEELPAHYAKRSLLNQIILPEDVANGVFALLGGLLSKSTGNILNIDGGIANAFVR